MRSNHRFVALLTGTFLIGSCVRQQGTPGIITQSKAIELAKQEFVRNGRKVEDYSVSVQTDGSAQKWIIWFDQKGQFPAPGGKSAVTVEKTTGKAVFLPGE